MPIDQKLSVIYNALGDNFTSIATQVQGTLVFDILAVVAGVVGAFLVFWLLRMAIRLFKRFAK